MFTKGEILYYKHIFPCKQFLAECRLVNFNKFLSFVAKFSLFFLQYFFLKIKTADFRYFFHKQSTLNFYSEKNLFCCISFHKYVLKQAVYSIFHHPSKLFLLFSPTKQKQQKQIQKAETKQPKY